jgi:hypothetical protein
MILNDSFFYFSWNVDVNFDHVVISVDIHKKNINLLRLVLRFGFFVVVVAYMLLNNNLYMKLNKKKKLNKITSKQPNRKYLLLLLLL